MIVTEKECEQWKHDKSRNPVTNKKIKIDSKKYKEIDKACKSYETVDTQSKVVKIPKVQVEFDKASITTILKSIHPHIQITIPSIKFLNDLLQILVSEVCPKVTSLQQIQTNIARKILLKNIIEKCEMYSHKEDYDNTPLIFSSNVIVTMLKKLFPEDLPNLTVIYLTGMLEFITTEIIELAGNVAIDNRKTRITPQHILLAIFGDKEFFETFNPMISHKTLLTFVDINPYILNIHKLTVYKLNKYLHARGYKSRDLSKLNRQGLIDAAERLSKNITKPELVNMIKSNLLK